jgi:TrmH family RNA methyltransferase
MSKRIDAVITSRQHPIVKEFRELARGDRDLMLLDGWHLLTEAASAEIPVEKIAICGPPSSSEQRVVDHLRRHGAQIVDVSGTVLNALSPVNAPTGVVASARRPSVTQTAILKPAPALVLAATGLQDPGNAGAIIRSAAAAGATGVVLDEASADPWGWKALRASMGSAFHVPVLRSRAIGTLINDWRSAGLRIAATVPRAGTSMHNVDFTPPTALLLGGEGAGLPDSLIAAADVRVSIPMRGGIESLNAAVAAAVLLYEAQRQRQLVNATRAGRRQ